MCLFCFTCVTQSLPLSRDAGHTEYAILFDAGSSGTRLRIYQFLASGPSLEPSDVLELSASPDKAKPGISGLADDPSQVEDYMTPLLESAKKTIPEDKQASTPIFLFATAGMRLIPQDQADAILKEVRKLFNDKEKCPFMFQDDDDARIITGKTEGIYAWVTINFLVGAYRSKGLTYGSLDLGGASHQNAWRFNSSHPDVAVVDFAGKKYQIFARSYLGFGQDQARERYLRVIAEEQNCVENCVVKSPCHNKGFKETLKFNGQERVFEGTAQVKRCREIIREVFFCHVQNVQKCPFYDQPKLKGRFYGFSSFYYILTGIGAVCSDCEKNKVTPRKVNLYSKSFCKKDYDDLEKNPYAKNHCFGGNFIYELLTEGYRLAPYKKVRVTNSLNGFKLGWTLGAVLKNTDIMKE